MKTLERIIENKVGMSKSDIILFAGDCVDNYIVMAIPRRPHPSYISGHQTWPPAPPRISFPPRNIPNAFSYPRPPLETSILSKPPPSPPITWPRPFPPMD